MFCPIWPARLSIAVMIFSCFLLHQTMRYNISINISAMAPLTANNNESLTESQSTTGLGWSSQERGLVLSSFHWGAFASSLLAGPVTERFGPKIVLFIVSFVTVILTLLTPPVAKISVYGAVGIRTVMGCFSGFAYTSSHVLIAHWAVPVERSRFSGALYSGSVGVVVAWSLCGVIIDTLGWEWGFYIFGIAGLAWCVFWWYMVYDTPREHPRISAAEKHYILEGTMNVSKHKSLPPYGSILTSMPAWAAFILTFGSQWGSYFMLNAAPMFISSVLGYKASATGFLSSLIYLVKFVTIHFFTFLGDFLLVKNVMSKNTLRKCFVLFSHILPAVIMAVLTYAGDPIIAYALIVLAMSFTGAACVSQQPLYHDMGPNFAGSTVGLASSLSKISGIMTPLVVSYFTEDDESLPPYGSILTSMPFWSAFILTFGSQWGSYFMLNAAPLFISSVLGYKTSATGFLSSIIYLVRFVTIHFFGFLGDFLLLKNLMSKTNLRKSFVLFSHILPAVIMAVLTYGGDPIIAFALIVLAMSFTGADCVSHQPLYHDMGPNFAGSTVGLASSLSQISGIMTPIVVSYFTEEDETSLDAWRPVFYTAAVIYMATSIFFILFGSAELQTWNEIKKQYAEKNPEKPSVI